MEKMLPQGRRLPQIILRLVKLLHFFISGILVLGLGIVLLGLHFPPARPQLCSTRTFPLLSYSLDFCNDGRLHEAIGLKQFPNIEGYQIQMVSS